MRVLWLSHNVPYPPIGGVLQRNYNLVHQSASRSELHLVALHQTALCPPDKLAEARAVLEGFCSTVKVLPIDCERSALGRVTLLGRVIAGWPYDVARYHSRECHAYLRTLQGEDYDVLHIDTVGLIPYRAHLSGTPAVLNHHNIESAMLARRAEQERRPLQRWALRRLSRQLARLERVHCRTFSSNLVVSPLDGERLRGIAGDVATAVIPNGVDPRYFDAQVNVDPECRTLVFVGGQSWYPNRDAIQYFLDEIWPKLIEREPRIEFVLIGRDPSSQTLEVARRDHRVRVLGFVDDIREAVARAAVYVCPFREGGGTRLKVLDAMAMRKAIVATSMAAEGLPVEDRRHVLKADDPGTFAECVLELLARPALRGQLGEASRALVAEQYDWRILGDRILQVYGDASRSRSHPYTGAVRA